MSAQEPLLTDEELAGFHDEPRDACNLSALITVQGRGERVLSAIRQVWQRLSRDPNNFGEPLYRLPALRMQVRCGAARPLAIHFAVCEGRPLVCGSSGIFFPIAPEPPSPGKAQRARRASSCGYQQQPRRFFRTAHPTKCLQFRARLLIMTWRGHDGWATSEGNSSHVAG
jgi:hypothetical protein